MIVKNCHHESIVFNYFFAKGEERKHYKTAGNIFYRGDTIYSYGTHFPMAVKCRNGYVLNGDAYSPSTSRHQTEVRIKADLREFWDTHVKTKKHFLELIEAYNKGHEKVEHPQFISVDHPVDAICSLQYEHGSERFLGYDENGEGIWTDPEPCPICDSLPEGKKFVHHAIVPFSSLQAADIEPEDVVLLDITEDSYETVKRRDPKTGEMKEYQLHHLGASLIRVGYKRYLSSIDSTSKSDRQQFFLVELQSRRVNTVEEAFRDLAGKLSDEQYERYLAGEIQRQGEFFLEPKLELSTRELKQQAKRVKRRHPGVLSIRVKTPDVKEYVKQATRKYLSTKNYLDSINPELIKVRRENGIPYYIQLDADSTIRTLSDDAFIEDNMVMCEGAMIHWHDLSGGDGNPHHARDAILTKDNETFIRGTLRHDEHKMIKMGNTWHQVFMNTAVNSWSADGMVD